MDNVIKKSISDLSKLAEHRLRKRTSAELERLRLLNQLIRFGVCTCHCHFSDSVFHSAAACCGNAKLADPN
jgi:hypothetical protein